MKEYYCDLCKERITPADIRMSFDIDVEDKVKDRVDMHAPCYYKFMAYARKNLIETETITVHMSNIG